jgi:hypothetical protein
MAKLTNEQVQVVREARATLRARRFEEYTGNADPIAALPEWSVFEPAEFIGPVADVVLSELPTLADFLALEVGGELLLPGGVGGRPYTVRRTA